MSKTNDIGQNERLSRKTVDVFPYNTTIFKDYKIYTHKWSNFSTEAGKNPLVVAIFLLRS